MPTLSMNTGPQSGRITFPTSWFSQQRNNRMARHGALVGAFLIVLANGTAGALVAGSVTLYRDTWGVPHIYADTPADGAYALGYAQAQDRLDDIYKAVRTGMGRYAEAFGPDWVDQDYIMRICKNEELSRKAWETASPELKALSESFLAGVQAYVAEHPRDVPEFAIELEPWMLGTIGRAMILRWPLGSIQDDLNNGKRKKQQEKKAAAMDPAFEETIGDRAETSIAMRSNQWAVAPRRSADGVPILHADPHLTWEGLAVLYEARVHAGDLHMCGFFLIGTPVMGYGHNWNVGWANTTGGPDTADVYEVKIKPSGLLFQYELDGEWKRPKFELIRIAVKGQEKPTIRPALFTELGPAVSEPQGDVIYVGATPYFELTGLFEQFYKMNVAADAKQFYQALGMLEYNEQNLMFADTTGTIGYVRNGRTPIRPDGYDWTAPVPASAATRWKGIHPIEDLVQIFDPPQGYMQNCNISPAKMMVDSPMTRDKYPGYIFNVAEWERNPRGDRSTMLLQENSLVTKEDAKRYAMDVYEMLAGKWQDAFRAALAAVGDSSGRHPAFDEASKAILDWDGEYAVDAKATVLFKEWRAKTAGKPEFLPIAEGKPIGPEQQKQLVDFFDQTLTELEKRYGRWDVPWGDVYKIGRGGSLFPMGGADYGNRRDVHDYTETLLSISWKENPVKPGEFIAYKGSMAMILMFFHKDGIESYSACAWGQSGRPDSPHYVDQAEKLFSKRQLKPTFWKKEDLLKNLESTPLVLEAP